MPGGQRAELPMSTHKSGSILSVTADVNLPETLTLAEAYRAAFYLTDLYVGVESSPDDGLVLFHQYLLSDPARWEDWKRAVGQARVPRPIVTRLSRMSSGTDERTHLPQRARGSADIPWRRCVACAPLAMTPPAAWRPVARQRRGA